MNFRRTSLHYAKKKFISIALMIPLLFLVGCVPKDVPTLAASKTPASYSGFSGITAAETVNGTKVTVRWNPSTDSSVVAYNIYDSTFKFQPRLIRTVTAPADRVTLSGLSSRSLYSLRVRAANAENKEDENTVDLQAIPYAGITNVEVISSTEARIHFADGSDADQINIYCKSAVETDFSLYGTVRNTALTQLVIDGLAAGVEYTCRVALDINGFVDNNPNKITFTPMGQASTLAFSAQPGNAAAGSPLSIQPVVRILDVNGNLVAGGPDSTATITLTVANASPSAGSVRGTFSMTAVGGIATFTDIYLEEAGQKIIAATKSDTSSIFFGTPEMSLNSSVFTITPGAVSAVNSLIAISPAPPDPPRIANGSEFYTVTFTLKDQYGNSVSGIRPTMASTISGDTISQPSQNTNSLGVTTGTISSTIADFAPNLRSLSIASPSGLSTVKVDALFVPGAASRLAYTAQPMNSPAGLLSMNNIQVEIQDAQGNRIRTGANATAEISLSIASNVDGAVLSGTNPKLAVDGVASFGDLGIDKTKNGYRLIASSGSFTPAFSNNFNITAGVPRKIGITGPSNVLSGACSAAITVRLLDLGDNPANAIQSTPVTFSGFGTGSFYTSNTCGGAPVGSTTTFTAGTNTKTIYYKGSAAESLAIVASDASAVMSAGNHAMTVSPNKLAMIAQAASPPAPASTPLSVIAGQCSTAIVITPQGDNNNAGPTFMPTTVSITGISGSDALIYMDPSCTVLANPLAVVLPINSGPDYSTRVYLKDPKAESLMISVSDLGAILTTTTSPQAVTILPSKLNFTGPTSVVAGQCSAVFTIQLRDTLNNPFAALTNVSLAIDGIPGTSVGRFYTSAACTGGGSRTSLTFPQGNTSLQVYFKSVQSDSLSISISDPAAQMTTSQTINLSVSPSALRIVKPVAGTAKNNICAGPFNVDTLDSLGSPTNAVSTITVNLGGAGSSAAFYSNNTCTTAITQLSFLNGENQKNFYFMGYYPENLTLTATDQAAVLAQGSETWNITAAKSWIGTANTDVDGSNNFLWFRLGAKPVAARTDGIYSASRLKFSPDHRYLYLVDADRARVQKYDYDNQSYVGWIGRFSNGGLPITGSTLTTPSSAACVATANGAITPGWCIGGVSVAASNSAAQGHMYNPRDVIDDGTFIYVVNYNGQAVTRYNSQTGAFDGYIGFISSNAGMSPATGGPATCSTVLAGNFTPGWCRGGTSSDADYGNPIIADGRLRHPQALTYDDNYIYVASRNSINRYLKSTGAFSGWIGMVSVQPTGGAAGCTTRVDGQMTTGWCYGGQAKEQAPQTAPIGGISFASDVFIFNDELHVLHTAGQIVKYNKLTGAVIGMLPDVAMNWHTAAQWATDGTKFYFADQRRIIKTEVGGLLEGWMGKVANNSGLSGSGCSGLAVNANTPGWCLGGSARPGMDERSFRNLVSIAYDGNGKLVVGQNDASGQIKRFDIATGAYEGMLSLESISPKKWINDAVSITARHGFDDDSMYNPQSSLVDGDYLYVSEYNSSRIKKFHKKTGELIGWIGAITSSPTGGEAGCVGANAYTAAPGWCLGANFQPASQWGAVGMVNTTTNGILRTPAGLASDGTYLYVTDRTLHRISRFNLATGAPAGWIGKIATSPTSGDPGCNGAVVGTFTPGWCDGGMSTVGTEDGSLYNPYGILYHGGILYVVDTNNHRVSSYNATTGAFNGWIGRIATAVSGGCTFASNGAHVVSTSGWCLGGTSSASGNASRGGSFNFWDRNGITTDGTHLYITNFSNVRIDKYTFAGVFMGSFRVRQDIYVGGWSTDPAVISTWGAAGCSRPTSVWTDGTFIYGVNYNPCNSVGTTFALWKVNLSLGQMVGWQGGIDPLNLPNGGDPGCAGATDATPGWCINGRPSNGLTMGTFSSYEGDLSGDANFLYVVDEVGNRVTRFPK